MQIYIQNNYPYFFLSWIVLKKFSPDKILLFLSQTMEYIAMLNMNIRWVFSLVLVI